MNGRTKDEGREREGRKGSGKKIKGENDVNRAFTHGKGSKSWREQGGKRGVGDGEKRVRQLDAFEVTTRTAVAPGFRLSDLPFLPLTSQHSKVGGGLCSEL